MSLFFRKFHKLLLILSMAGLPLQGALAAIMPLCAQAMQAQDLRAGSTGIKAPAHSATPTACSQHGFDDHPQPIGNEGDMNDTAFALSCDGVVCHVSGNGLPPVAAVLNSAGGFSYAASFNARFTSSSLPQPQRPPLT